MLQRWRETKRPQYPRFLRARVTDDGRTQRCRTTTHPLTAAYAVSVHVGCSQSQPRWTSVYLRSRLLGGMQLDVAMADGLAGQGGGGGWWHMRSRNILFSFPNRLTYELSRPVDAIHLGYIALTGPNNCFFEGYARRSRDGSYYRGAP